MCDTSAPFNLGLSWVEISQLSDEELAKGCKLARELVKMGYDKLIRTQDQLAAVKRVRTSIARNGGNNKTSAMRGSEALLRKEYEALHAQEKAQRAAHQDYLITRQPWDEEKRARDKATANQKRLDDLRKQVLESFDNDLLQQQVENSCHCHCHCHCH